MVERVYLCGCGSAVVSQLCTASQTRKRFLTNGMQIHGGDIPTQKENVQKDSFAVITWPRWATAESENTGGSNVSRDLAVSSTAARFVGIADEKSGGPIRLPVLNHNNKTLAGHF